MANPIVKTQAFMGEVVTELKKSSWPTRRELIDSTVIVMLTVLVLGLFVSFADIVFTRIIAMLTRAA
jgi:preprotein translocase subunit SecE